MIKNKKLRVAVIGCGNIYHMHAISANLSELAELICVCDIKENKAVEAGKQYSVPYYTDYKEMIKNEDLDLVHICTPHYLHTEMAQFALLNGLNVISEKPMSIAYEDALKTVELAKKQKLKYGVIFQCRYNTPSKFVKENIKNGVLGKVLCARVVLTWNRTEEYYSQSDWKGTVDKEGGGVIIDQAIHSLDLANWFIDSEIDYVNTTMINRLHDCMAVEDTAEGLIKYSCGASLMFWATNNYAIDEPIEIRLFCENGVATLSYDDANIVLNNGQKRFINQENSDIYDYSGRKQYWGLSHKVQIEQFYRSVLGLEELEISGQEALKTQKLVTMIYESARKGIDVRP